MTCAAAQIHDCGDKPHVHTIEEIAFASLALLIDITHQTKVYLLYSVSLEGFDGHGIIVLVQIPKVCKIIHHAVRNYAKGHFLTHILVHLHETVDSIVECRVATDDNDGMVSVVDKHSDQPVYAATAFTLHMVIQDVLFLKALLYLLPSAFRRA